MAAVETCSRRGQDLAVVLLARNVSVVGAVNGHVGASNLCSPQSAGSGFKSCHGATNRGDISVENGLQGSQTTGRLGVVATV